MGLPDIHRHESHHKPNYPQLSRKFVARRISEGETGRLKEELKCQACGKGYKHVSSLAKHLWEHTPEWNVTSKLLISKHQQVQLLEAASILVSMNEDDEKDEKDDEAIDSREESPDDSPAPATPFLPDTPRAEPHAGDEVPPVLTDAQDEAVQGLSDLHNAGPKSLTPAYEEKAGTPSRDIPIHASKITKHPRGNRRRSSAGTQALAGSLAGSLSSSLGADLRASPLPESLLARDFPRRRRVSSLVPSSVPRTDLDVIEDEEDGLQDPEDLDAPRTPRQSPRKTSPKSVKSERDDLKKEDVFGMEV